MKTNSCIYEILNIINGKRYIGSTVNYRTRIHRHFWELKNNTHSNNHLQSAFIKYGESSFVVNVLAKCPKEYKLKLEQWFLDNLNPEYNYQKIASSSGGFRDKSLNDHLSMLHSGVNNPFYGKRHTPETERKIHDSNKIPVIQLDKKTNAIIGIFKSAVDAKNILGLPHHNNIYYVCNGLRKTAFKFKWAWYNNQKPIV